MTSGTIRALRNFWTASIARLASEMGVQTIAEFVESEAIAARLRGIGVTYAQGYGIEKPRPLT